MCMCSTCLCEWVWTREVSVLEQYYTFIHSQTWATNEREKESHENGDETAVNSNEWNQCERREETASAWERPYDQRLYIDRRVHKRIIWRSGCRNEHDTKRETRYNQLLVFPFALALFLFFEQSHTRTYTTSIYTLLWNIFKAMKQQTK